jgi:hypothetical protein
MLFLIKLYHLVLILAFNFYQFHLCDAGLFLRSLMHEFYFFMIEDLHQHIAAHNSVLNFLHHQIVPLLIFLISFGLLAHQ